jgi:two-component system alkaline phosphatase synthesis response regulator PhoP
MAETSDNNTPGYTALVVDDDLAIRTLVRIRLSRAGFIVTEAGDGEEGLTRALALTPDVVVVDAMMPVRDGFSMAQELRDRGMECAIVMLSARGQASDLRRGYDAGVDDYIIKPFDASDVVRRVQEAIERRRGTP